MREKTLNSIISLFAIIAAYKPDRGFSLYRNLLEVYLSSLFSSETVKVGLETYEKEILQFQQQLINYSGNSSAFFIEEIEAHCYILSRELMLPQRILILVYLMDFESGRIIYENIESEGSLLLFKISTGLNISAQDYNDCKAFVTESFEKVGDDNDMMVVTDDLNFTLSGINTKTITGLSGRLFFLRLNKLNTILFKVGGEATFVLSGNHLFKHRTYVLDKGGVININEDLSLSYNQIERFFLNILKLHPFSLKVENLEYKFTNGVYGINKVSFKVNSGELMAIMGGSGSGKTTLMNLLIGLHKPSAGSVTLNGVDIYSRNKLVKGHMGYVPQDDALYENLTAFQNIFFIANLSLNNLYDNEKINLVNQLLRDLGLWEIRDLKVGSPLDKVISGGQRKRINIALELIRDPGILFLDEPTSGLSSTDTISIMTLLRNMANNGRLIIMNIHQPSSSVFKMFDKLLFIDQGGYPVYFGSSMHVVGYLKKKLGFVDAHQNDCPQCGNLNPDDVFSLTEIKKIHAFNSEKSKRQVSPLEWHEYFFSNLITGNDDKVSEVLESANLRIPNPFKQFIIYLNRNWILKTRDIEYLLLSILITPMLASVLSIFTKHINPSIGKYQYYENENIPAFFFMSVIVALFVGVMSSATEIIRDRAVLKREAFLNLSYGSYFMSKIFYLTFLSGVQMLCYVIVSLIILKIPLGSGFFFYILWAATVSANALGLLLSTVFKTMASVYLSIPFLLIPQILFAGAVIDFNKINPAFSSLKYVPAFADVMVSRWAFEAIMVTQFIDNDYSYSFYQPDKELAELTYYRSFLIPEIEKDFYGDSFSSAHQLTFDSINYKRVLNGICQLEIFNPYYGSKGVIGGSEFLAYLQGVKRFIASSADSVQEFKDNLIHSLGDTLYNKYKINSTNKKLNEILTDEKSFNKLLVSSDSYIRKLYPVYFNSDNDCGRAHFYAPGKYIAGYELSTPVFNLLVILLFSFVLAIISLMNPVRY